MGEVHAERPEQPEQLRRWRRQIGRRRTTLVVGAVVIVVAVAVAALLTRPTLVDDGPGADVPMPTNHPSAAAPEVWVHQVPADFPIGSGLPLVDGGGSPLVLSHGFGGQGIANCANSRYVVGSGSRRHQVAASNGSSRRLLRLFADDDEARRAFEAVIGTDECGSLPAADGDQARSWTRRGYRERFELVRVGDAVLLAVGPDGRDLGIEPVVADLCVFAAHPCASPPKPPAALRAVPGYASRIPASVDLRSGLGPGPRVPAGTRVGAYLNLCGPPGDLEDARVVAQARAGALDDARTLLLYSSADAASREVTGLRAYLDRCSAHPFPGTSVAVRTDTVGDESSLATDVDVGTGAGYTYSWYRVVRIGNAILLTQSYLPADEGAGDLDTAIAAQADTLTALLDQMRIFER